METTPTESSNRLRQNIHGSLLIRLINKTIERIRKDAAIIMLPSREETITSTLTNHLQQAGIPLENDEAAVSMDEEKNLNNQDKDLPPLTDNEIKAALDGIPGLTVVEKVIFADDLQRFTRKSQEEFIDLLKLCR